MHNEIKSIDPELQDRHPKRFRRWGFISHLIRECSGILYLGLAMVVLVYPK